MVDAEQVANLLRLNGFQGMLPKNGLCGVLASWGSPPPEDPEGDVDRAVEAGAIIEEDGLYYLPGSPADHGRSKGRQ